MIQKILIVMTVVSSISEGAQGSPHHHNDEYGQVLRLLKEARKQQRREQYYGGGNYNQGSASSQNSQFQFPSFGGGSGGNSGGSSGGSSGGDSPPTPILTPGNNRQPGNFGTVGGAISGIIPPPGGSSSNSRPIIPNFPSGSQIVDQIGVRPPYPIQQVNNGVSTILEGVKKFDLGQILRGAFIFPRNENVRSVANTVIDQIFGAQRTIPRRR